MTTPKHFKVTILCTEHDGEHESYLSVSKDVVAVNMNNAHVETHKLLNRLEGHLGVTVDQAIVREIYTGRDGEGLKAHVRREGL